MVWVVVVIEAAAVAVAALSARASGGGGVDSGNGCSRSRSRHLRMWVGPKFLRRGKVEASQRPCFEWVYFLQCYRNLRLLG